MSDRNDEVGGRFELGDISLGAILKVSKGIDGLHHSILQLHHFYHSLPSPPSSLVGAGAAGTKDLISLVLKDIPRKDIPKINSSTPSRENPSPSMAFPSQAVMVIVVTLMS